MSVEQRLRDGLAAELGRINPDVETMLAEVESGAGRQRTRRTVALAAAATVAAVGGLVWAGGSLGWLTGQEDVQPVERPEEPAEWQVDPDGDWVRVEDAGLDGVGPLSKVVDVGGRLVAIGGGPTPIVTSTDGVDWTPVDVPAEDLQNLIVGGPGVIASGSTVDGDPALWTSPDGLTWTQVDDPAELLSAHGSGIRAVTVGGPGFEEALGREPTTWISGDGLTWMPIDATEDSVAIDDVTMGGPGFVAVGLADLAGETWGSPPQAADIPGMHTAAVWTSVDGRTWSRVPHDPGVFSPEPWVEMNLVTAGGAGLVAVGNASGGGNSRTTVWTSDDGQTWVRVLDELDVLGGVDAEIVAVIDTGRGYLAMGQRCCEVDEYGALGSFPWYTNAELWTSVDGRAWERVEDDSFATPEEHLKVINDVIATPLGLVAVGGASTQEDSAGEDPPGSNTATVWVMEQP